MENALTLVNKVEEDELENQYEDLKIVFRPSEDYSNHKKASASPITQTIRNNSTRV